MSETAYFPEDAKRIGIDIRWTRSSQRLDIGGWYDSFVALDGGSVSLREFFDRLGITEKDCKNAWEVQG